MIGLSFLAVKAAVLSALLFVQRHWRLLAGGVLLLAALLFVYRACGGSEEDKPTLTPQEVIKAQQAIDTANAEAMREVLVQSDVRSKQIDANVANAKVATVNAAHEARQKYRDMEAEELARELERRARQ